MKLSEKQEVKDICFSGLHGRAIEKKGSMKGIFFFNTRILSKEHVARTFQVKSLPRKFFFLHTPHKKTSDEKTVKGR